MSRACRLAAAVALALATAGSVHAQAVGVDVFASSDADDTDVAKLGLNLDWTYDGPDRRQGVRLEQARFRPLGQETTRELRAYVRAADKLDGWTWNAMVGSDGDTVLGAASVHNEARFRQEYFLEREIVETPQGLAEGVYYTFAGGALDLPMGERDSATVVAAVQDFTGQNVRFHLRGNYIHVLQPDWGLSAQIRGRYFHSSEPGEYDYFSPKDHLQVLPTLQLRGRRAGWRYVLAAGLGAQWQTGDGWQAAGALNAQVTSPPTSDGWAFEAALAYSNTPTGASYTYEYHQLSLGLRRVF